MNKYLFFLLLVMSAAAVQAQTDYRVVFDMTNKDTASH